MSTDRSRLVSSIRRIVLQDPEIRDLIDEFRNRGGFGSTSATIEGAEDARRICCDGSVSGNSNPGSDTKDPNEDSRDGLDDDDPAEIGSGRLTGVTDCATGEPVCFDGLDWIPPDEWECPTCPPPEEGYEDGYYWVAGVYQGLSPNQVCFTAFTENEVEGTYDGADRNSDTNYDCMRIVDGNRGSFAGASRSECPGSEGICDEDPPLEDSWPEDGCTNLAIKNGSIVGSKYDPENDGTYSKPMSEIELCGGSGNSFLLRPSANGGWKSIKSLDGEPDGAVQNGWLYSAYDDVIQQITPSEFSDPKV